MASLLFFLFFILRGDLILVKDSKFIAWGYTGWGYEIIPDIDTNKWRFSDGGTLTLIDEETVDVLT